MNFTKNGSQATKLNATSAKSMAENLTAIWGGANDKFIVAPCPEFGKFAIAHISGGSLVGFYAA